MRTIVKRTEGSYVYVDSCYTLDNGYETMVFECDSNGDVTSWKDIDVCWYSSFEKMEKGHEEMCKKWKLK